MNVTENKTTSKRQAAADIWMNYFNDFLYKNNVISESTMRKMRGLISVYVHSMDKK